MQNGLYIIDITYMYKYSTLVYIILSWLLNRVFLMMNIKRNIKYKNKKKCYIKKVNQVHGIKISTVVTIKIMIE